MKKFTNRQKQRRMKLKGKAKELLIEELKNNQRVKLLSSLRKSSICDVINSIEDRFTCSLSGNNRLKCQVVYRDMDHDIFIMEWVYLEIPNY